MRKRIEKNSKHISRCISGIFGKSNTGVYAANGAEGRYKTESTVLQETQNTGEVPELQTEQFTEDAQLQADQGVEAVLISEQGPYYRPVSIDETVSDSIKESGEGGNKYYTFSLKESGRLDIRFVSHMSGYSVYLYDVNGTWIWESTSNGWNEATQMVSNTHTIDLMQGTYQMVVSGYKYWSPWGDGDFNSVCLSSLPGRAMGSYITVFRQLPKSHLVKEYMGRSRRSEKRKRRNISGFLRRRQAAFPSISRPICPSIVFIFMTVQGQKWKNLQRSPGIRLRNSHECVYN